MKNPFIYVLAMCIVFFASALLLYKRNPNINLIAIPGNDYVARVKINDHTVVRLLILKHSYESLAEDEQRDILQAANLAASRGLTIKDIGSFHVNGQGHAPRRVVWGSKVTLQNLKAFVSEQMKTAAESGDTLVIYTTGHGGKDGTMMSLGNRSVIGRIFAEAAEENDQETLWWQSSCYAAANLPKISSMTPKQQDLFSMIASSTAFVPSYWGDQTEPMKKVFLALAVGSDSIDPDQDGTVTAGELRRFLSTIKEGGAKLLFSKSPDEPIFGMFGARMIPIRDWQRPPMEYPRDYIPYPKRRF